ADSWNAVQNLNLRAPVLLSKDAGLRMKRDGGGAIVNVTDWGAFRPHTEYLAYAAAKAGLVSATAGLARALAPEVRVNSVAPGAILLPEGASPEYDTRVRAATPLGRWGGSEAVVSTVLFLIGNDFITGGNYLVDGGRSVR
ncbi:MAG: SDR family oxidoreductase, partial [Planctomycetota bacterium]|nr:SDR family oxidoreductase [Planctomycetota bacterium]